MLKYTISHKPHHSLAPQALHKPALLSSRASNSLVAPNPRSVFARTSKQCKATRTPKRFVTRAINIKPSSLFGFSDTSTNVKATVTVVKTVGDTISQLTSVTQGLDNTADVLGRTLLVELVSAEADSSK